MRKWLLIVPLTLVPLTARADFLDDLKRGLAKDQLIVPKAVAPPAVEQMQVLPSIAPPSTVPGVPPTIQVQDPVPPRLPRPVPIGGGGSNSCSLAFNAVCDEPAPCAAGTDGHDCVQGARK